LGVDFRTQAMPAACPIALGTIRQLDNIICCASLSTIRTTGALQARLGARVVSG